MKRGHKYGILLCLFWVTLLFSPVIRAIDTTGTDHEVLEKYKNTKIKYTKQMALTDAFMHRLQFLLDIEKKYGRRAPKTKDFVQFNLNSLFKKMRKSRQDLRQLGDEISDRGLDSEKYNSSDIPENQKTHFSEFLLSIHRLDLEGTTVWKEFFNITDKCS